MMPQVSSYEMVPAFFRNIFRRDCEAIAFTEQVTNARPV